MIWQIVLACVGSSGLFAFITFLIQRKDSRLSKLNTIEQDIKSLELDSCRTQMLILMNHYPEQEKEILMLAEKYFVELKGNFYMDTLFRKYLDERKIKTPSWFFK